MVSYCYLIKHTTNENLETVGNKACTYKVSQTKRHTLILNIEPVTKLIYYESTRCHASSTRNNRFERSQQLTNQQQQSKARANQEPRKGSREERGPEIDLMTQRQGRGY